MGENLVVGLGTMALCLTIQCVVVALVLQALFRLERRGIIRPTLPRISALLTSVLLVMLVGNLVQIAIWAGLFRAYGECTNFDTAFHHSVVNFTTLGYGDIVMSEERRLLGGLEAANGVLMLGLTTSLLFAVLSELLHRAWAARLG